MTSERTERMAENEALFRIANERMAEWEEYRASTALETYFCECAAPECHEHVDLRKADYYSIRSDSRWFLVLSGHELLDVERVVERNESWTMVEKVPEVTDTVEALDPRRDG